MDHAKIVLETAIEEWSRHVEEPPGKGWRRIDEYIRGSSSMFWRWLQRYRRNGQSAWCGAFAAHCYGVAGLSKYNRIHYMPSTARLYKWSSKRAHRKRGAPGPKDGRARRIAPAALLPGDIAVVGPEPAGTGASRRRRKAAPRWGKHIVIVDKRQDMPAHVSPTRRDHIATIEGNAKGNLPDGRWREGVVVRDRPLRAGDPKVYRVLYGVRPLAEDYDAG